MPAIQEEECPFRYALLSVTRDELEIIESFCHTHKEAFTAMIEDIILLTDYENEDELQKAAQEGLCGLTENDAWAETNQFGTGQWKIIELPVVPKNSYIYRQINDDYPADEENIQVFNDREDARKQLRMDVEEHFGVPWEYVPFKINYYKDEDEEDKDMVECFEPDCVKVRPDGEEMLYWLIEEKEKR